MPQCADCSIAAPALAIPPFESFSLFASLINGGIHNCADSTKIDHFRKNPNAVRAAAAVSGGCTPRTARDFGKPKSRLARRSFRFAERADSAASPRCRRRAAFGGAAARPLPCEINTITNEYENNLTSVSFFFHFFFSVSSVINVKMKYENETRNGGEINGF